MSGVQKRAASKRASLTKDMAHPADAAPEQTTPHENLRDGRPDKNDQRFLTVTELARELGITARALRFYEDKKLIAPRRVANTRVYTNRERARMILILRGKRLGFSLREIKDYLDLYDADPAHVTQAKALLQKIETRRHRLEDQRIAVDQALNGLKELEIDALATLAEAGRRAQAPRSGAPKSIAGKAVAGKAAATKVALKSNENLVFAGVASTAGHQEPNL